MRTSVLSQLVNYLKYQQVRTNISCRNFTASLSAHSCCRDPSAASAQHRPGTHRSSDQAARHSVTLIRWSGSTWVAVTPSSLQRRLDAYLMSLIPAWSCNTAGSDMMFRVWRDGRGERWKTERSEGKSDLKGPCLMFEAHQILTPSHPKRVEIETKKSPSLQSGAVRYKKTPGPWTTSVDLWVLMSDIQ